MAHHPRRTATGKALWSIHRGEKQQGQRTKRKESTRNKPGKISKETEQQQKKNENNAKPTGDQHAEGQGKTAGKTSEERPTRLGKNLKNKRGPDAIHEVRSFRVSFWRFFVGFHFLRFGLGPSSGVCYLDFAGSWFWICKSERRGTQRVGLSVCELAKWSRIGVLFAKFSAGRCKIQRKAQNSAQPRGHVQS